DDESDEDRSALEGILTVELAAAALEFPDRRRRQGARPAVREVQAPLARRRIVEAQAQAFDVAVGAIDLELDQVGSTLPDLGDHGGALVFDPGRGPAQGMLKTPEMGFPGADLEVEIVLPILCRRRLNAPLRSGWLLAGKA